MPTIDNVAGDVFIGLLQMTVLPYIVLSLIVNLARISRAESRGLLLAAIDTGVTFWDTSDIYGPKTNELLVGRALEGVRDSVVLATKFGILRDDAGEFMGLNSRPEYVREACDASLKRLGVDHIDLYYQHRVDPETPIEDTVGAMSRLVEEGKVLYLGLSEASADDLAAIDAIFPPDVAAGTRYPEPMMGMLNA